MSHKLTSPTTTKADLIVRDGGSPSMHARLPVGTDYYPLMADSGESLGLRYAPAVASCVRAYVPSGETVTIPDRCQVFVSGEYTVEAGGTLITETGAKVVVWNG